MILVVGGGRRTDGAGRVGEGLALRSVQARHSGIIINTKNTKGSFRLIIK